MTNPLSKQLLLHTDRGLETSFPHKETKALGAMTKTNAEIEK